MQIAKGSVEDGERWIRRFCTKTQANQKHIDSRETSRVDI